jgi:hypothetical protein
MCKVNNEPFGVSPHVNVNNGEFTFDQTDNLRIDHRMEYLDNILSELNDIRNVVNSQPFVPKVTYEFKEINNNTINDAYDISISGDKLNQIMHVHVPTGITGEPGITGTIGDKGNHGDEGDEGDVGRCGLYKCS